MEIWILYAIVSAFLAGIHNFTMKYAAEKNYDVSLISIYSYGIGIFFTGIYLLFQDINMSSDALYWLVIFAFINGIFFLLSIFSRVESMKNIDTVIFFPVYKTVGPIVVTCISLFYFKEVLTIKEILGIIVGITVPLLLITKSENTIQKNLYRGLFFLVITAIFTGISSMASKEVMVREYDVGVFVLVSSFFGLFFSKTLYLFNKKNNKNKKKKNSKGVVKFALLSGIFHLASFVCFTLALSGNLAIVFTINSFSILIPIILSIFYFNDHFNLKKGLVIALSIISIILFI